MSRAGKAPHQAVAQSRNLKIGNIGIVSLDEVEAQENSDTADDDDEEAIAEIADDDTDIPDSGDEKDDFLETEDEPESDVKGIIGGPVKDEGSA